MSDPHPPLAAYLNDEVSSEIAESIDKHLIDCDTCWHEVRLARAARRAVQRSAEQIPDDVRARIRNRLSPQRSLPTITNVDIDRATSSRRVFLAVGLAVGCLVAGLAAATLFAGPAADNHADTSLAVTATAHPTLAAPGSEVDGALQAAVMCYRQKQLPGVGIPTHAAPDLTTMGLHIMGGAVGDLDHQPTVAYAYASATESVYVFTATTPFQIGGTAGATDRTFRIDGLTVTSNAQVSMLVVGTDPALVAAVAGHLA